MKNNANSIPEIARQLEEGNINPVSLDKDTLRQCAALFKSRSYSIASIAEILKVKKRTVYRYLRKSRAIIKMGLGENFQQILMAEVMNDMRLRCQRLLRLSYSENLSPYEEAKIVYLAHQIEMDALEVLERLGYLQKTAGEDEVFRAHESAVKERLEREAMGARWMQINQLTPEQRDFIAHYYAAEKHMFPYREKETRLKIYSMVDKFMEENEKERKALLLKFHGVVGFSKLPCNVLVYNRLH